MTNLAEIQEAIEKLAPEERAALREWLDESDPDTAAVIRERIRQIRAGEASLIDGDQVQQEMRQCSTHSRSVKYRYDSEAREELVMQLHHREFRDHHCSRET
jgi:hypothetical protein